MNSPQRPSVPPELLKDWQAGNVVLFVGAGASVDSGAPSWRELIDRLMTRLSGSAPTADLPTLARYYELELGRRALVSEVIGQIRNLRPNAIHREIARLRPKVTFTTNYDTLLEQAFRERHVEFQSVVGDEEVAYAYDAPSVIVKVHGCIDRPATLVITVRDYEEFILKHPSTSRILASQLQTRTILLVGYSASDPDFRGLLTTLHSETGVHSRRLFMLTFDMHPLEQRELESRQVQVVSLGPIGLDAGDRVATWLRNAGDLLEDASVPTDRVAEDTELVSGKLGRTRRIITEARAFDLTEPAHSIIRMRQGFSALSLGDHEHPGDPVYSTLLAEERRVFEELLRKGHPIRLIVGRRPVFASDLVYRSDSDLRLASRLLARCTRLIDRLTETSSNPTLNLVVACSGVSHFADLALGERLLIRGVRNDSESGYSLTTVDHRGEKNRTYNEGFDQEFRSLTQETAFNFDDMESRLSANDRAKAMLADSARLLEEWLSAEGGASPWQ